MNLNEGVKVIAFARTDHEEDVPEEVPTESETQEAPAETAEE